MTRADLAVTDAALVPEFADASVTMRKSETIRRFRVRENGRIAIKRHVGRLCPGDPVLELLHVQRTTVNFASRHLCVTGMQVGLV